MLFPTLKNNVRYHIQSSALALAYSINSQSLAMSRPSPLAIATSSVLRLVKEEQSYHKELEGQENRVRELELGSAHDEDGNREYVLRQEVSLLELGGVVIWEFGGGSKDG